VARRRCRQHARPGVAGWPIPCAISSLCVMSACLGSPSHVLSSTCPGGAVFHGLLLYISVAFMISWSRLPKFRIVQLEIVFCATISFQPHIVRTSACKFFPSITQLFCKTK
jgi:hypothetical protein